MKHTARFPVRIYTLPAAMKTENLYDYVLITELPNGRIFTACGDWGNFDNTFSGGIEKPGYDGENYLQGRGFQRPTEPDKLPLPSFKIAHSLAKALGVSLLQYDLQPDTLFLVLDRDPVYENDAVRTAQAAPRGVARPIRVWL